MKSRVCRICGNEKIRFERHGGYTFRCDCLAWREYMKVLERARKTESRRPGRKPVAAGIPEGIPVPQTEPTPEAVVA